MMDYFKFDRVSVGVISGFLLPFIVGLVIFVFSAGNMSVGDFLLRIAETKVITHSISICVFPNVLIFLGFNWLDMLKATRGVLAITIVWAIIVFGVKFLA
jgi:hypothetical protein